ncbi:MAG: recombinase family protein [Chloroflexi bacterium]|nr:recombinase family protein [Chloroflexota bacterium]
MRVVTYARVSTEDQAKHGYSLPSQIEAGRKYAEERGWTVVAEISDDGISGATLDRPGLDRIRDMAKAREIEAIIVYDLDRLSRKAVYQMLIEEELGKAGITIHYVQGDYGDSDEGRLMKQIRASIAEYERAKITERMVRGKRSKARQGRAGNGGTTAYGYRHDGNGSLVIEEREAQVVRTIFELYTNGEDLSISEIARRLTASPHKTSTGNKKWRPCTVGCILNNETYAGTLYYNKYRKKSEYIDARETRPKDEWIPVPVPPIVSRATFETAKRRLAHNRKVKRRQTRHPYLLGGMLSCAECGYAYVSTSSNDHRYYYDSGKYTDKKHHPTSSLRADLVEEKVWEAVKEILLNPSALWEGYKAREAEVLDQKVKLTERLETMLKLKDKAQHKLDALTEAYLDPDIGISKAEYTRRRQAIEKEIAEWEREAQGMQERLKAEAITQEQMEAIEEFAAKISQGIDLLGFEEKRKVLTMLEVKGMIHREDGKEWIELEGLFPPTEVCVSYKAY